MLGKVSKIGRKLRLIQGFSWTKEKYDVIVIGGGHAGCQAAYASARTGAKTLLITQNIQTIGEMSCNPSIGGIGKGHLVREIDALGGIMGRVADISALQFKVLNSSKGEAVQGPREQIDRDIYKKNMRKQLENTQNLSIQAMGVEDFEIDETTNTIRAVKSADNQAVEAKNFIITTGTFLRGMIHIGRKSYPAGRHMRDSEKVQPPSIGLAHTFKRLNFPMGRATTGTPPRLRKSTINYSGLQSHGSDDPIQPFSFVYQFKGFKTQHDTIQCHMTETNLKTHSLIQKFRNQLPVFQGNQGKGQGPRYCPAIEKKVIRFPDKKSHQIWLQPEGVTNETVYPNGLNNGFPAEIQLQLLRTIKGLENVEMIRPGYAVQYDYICPTHLRHSLQSTILKNLFLAGQINGTTGYEQAAAQGIIAGFNAGFMAQNKTPYILDRTKAYIGVLIDDLVTQGISQPYRMFTSRSEYRLLLRAENADQRITPDAISLGVLGKQQKQIFQEKQKLVSDGIKKLELYRNSIKMWAKFLPQYKFAANPANKSAAQLISTYEFIKISDLDWIEKIDPRVHKRIQAQLKYQPYTQKMKKEIQDMKKNEVLKDISHLCYDELKPHLTLEQYELLSSKKPKTIHAASRIGGVRPSTLLYLHYISGKKQRTNSEMQGQI